MEREKRFQLEKNIDETSQEIRDIKSKFIGDSTEHETIISQLKQERSEK